MFPGFFMFFLPERIQVSNPYYILREGKDVTEEMAAHWKETTLQTYEACDIYNADEFGLFYQLLPQKTLNLKKKKKEKCAGSKYSKISPCWEH